MQASIVHDTDEFAGNPFNQPDMVGGFEKLESGFMHGTRPDFQQHGLAVARTDGLHHRP